eukprot:12146292-Alexandrium_andersonii.AAC.1
MPARSSWCAEGPAARRARPRLATPSTTSPWRPAVACPPLPALSAARWWCQNRALASRPSPPPPLPRLRSPCPRPQGALPPSVSSSPRPSTPT